MGDFTDLSFSQQILLALQWFFSWHPGSHASRYIENYHHIPNDGYLSLDFYFLSGLLVSTSELLYPSHNGQSDPFKIVTSPINKPQDFFILLRIKLQVPILVSKGQ